VSVVAIGLIRSQRELLVSVAVSSVRLQRKTVTGNSENLDVAGTVEASLLPMKSIIGFAGIVCTGGRLFVHKTRDFHCGLCMYLVSGIAVLSGFRTFPQAPATAVAFELGLFLMLI